MKKKKAGFPGPYGGLHRRLLGWYRRHGRHDLPWRRTRDPYRIYLSEIMLQQTQVNTVLGRFYFPFLDLFPTLESVAKATEEEVLKAWEGLGYYSRARHLHRTARITGGTLPATAKELERLPGIGRSTAAAIACFSHGEAVPILDANVRRILFRFFRRRRAGERELWRMAQRLFDGEHPYEYNQAMMDLGATVCTPATPRCALCPLADECRGKETPERYPERRKNGPPPLRRQWIVIRTKARKAAMIRSSGRFHGGLWGFPRSDTPIEGRSLGKIRQSYSHFILEAEIIEAALPGGISRQRIVYFAPEEIDALPLGAADRKVLEIIRGKTLC